MSNLLSFIVKHPFETAGIFMYTVFVLIIVFSGIYSKGKFLHEEKKRKDCEHNGAS